MSKNKKRITILLAEDSIEEQTVMQQALAASHLGNDLHIVQDGEELLDYLHYRSQYSDKARAPRPDLILLDLYLPKIDGFQVLQAIKSNPQLRRIPIVVLTDSKSEEDIRASYELGASSYLAKPMTFELLVEAVNTLGDYWFDIVELPPTNTLE
jgi:CheY-like chemotaxis protein